jgi:hypothetical protein
MTNLFPQHFKILILNNANKKFSFKQDRDNLDTIRNEILVFFFCVFANCIRPQNLHIFPILGNLPVPPKSIPSLLMVGREALGLSGTTNWRKKVGTNAFLRGKLACPTLH